MKTAPKSIIFMNLTPRSVVSLKKPHELAKNIKYLCTTLVLVALLFIAGCSLVYSKSTTEPTFIQIPTLKAWETRYYGSVFFFHIFYPKIVHIYECYMVFECHLYLIITNVLKHKKSLYRAFGGF